MNILALSTLLLQLSDLNTPRGVYGDDDRIEALDAPESLQSVVMGVAAQIPKRIISSDELGYFYDSKYSVYNSVYIDDLSTALPLCESVQFKGQQAYAQCSSFLIAPNKLLTAGHCTTSVDYCQNNYWVFDYTDSENTRIDSKNIYECESIDNQAYKSDRKQDYAIITLKRNVLGRSPLRLASGPVEVGASVAVAGFPSGLPMKMDLNAKVLRDKENFFYMAADTFAGNSGGAVVDKSTGQVVGILSSGAEDYSVDMANRCVEISTHQERYGNEAAFKISSLPLFK